MSDESPNQSQDYILDLSSTQASPVGRPPNADSDKTPPRPYLSILFKCCNLYAPIYKNSAGSAYAGHCPRCARAVRVPIGPGGSTSRVFIAR